MIPYNKPYLTGKELLYIRNAVELGKISGNGYYTNKCQNFFEEKYNFKKCLLTTSCTDALEMAALLCDIQPGDEVIIPSYTFVSTALAFVRQGAKIIFADSFSTHPNLDVRFLEKLVSDKTKAIVPVHYAGVACDMDVIIEFANRHNLFVIEDAAQAIDSFYLSDSKGSKLMPLGSIGHFATFSFHETKNIIAGEGGMLVINDEKYISRAEILWEKGTNRAEFFRGEVNKYGWVDTGSSFLPSEVIAAFLWAQLESIVDIQEKRKTIWMQYWKGLKPLSDKGYFKLPFLPAYATNNAHIFYLVCINLEERTQLIEYMKDKGVLAVFHYLSLHSSEYYSEKHDGRNLPESDKYSDTLVRLPLYYELTANNVQYVIDVITSFFETWQNKEY